MGARPRFCLLSVGVPRGLWRGGFAGEFYRGVRALAVRHGVRLIGGDTSSTPERVVNQLNDELRRVLNRPEVKERFFNTAVEVVSTSPAETAAFVKADTATTARLIRDAGIRVER